ncbi:hypothetical protein [Psychrosphaera algicola]|uniref:Uncharacterized protein n=2 Tax=Psychrosphaera TaxID=907197 RepID=A0ABT5FET7_9GAMM|nr:hypothetical protein [Psychrosphaera sp. G1-22]MDC2890058.1 hypothetical protein [Psychrosphaera sp. G1-22]
MVALQIFSLQQHMEHQSAETNVVECTYCHNSGQLEDFTFQNITTAPPVEFFAVKSTTKVPTVFAKLVYRATAIRAPPVNYPIDLQQS